MTVFSLPSVHDFEFRGVLVGSFVNGVSVWVCLKLEHGFLKSCRSGCSYPEIPCDTDDVMLDTWFKVFARFLHHKVTLFFFSKALHLGCGLYAAVGSCYILLPCPIHGSLNLTLQAISWTVFRIQSFGQLIHCNIAHTW